MATKTEPEFKRGQEMISVQFPGVSSISRASVISSCCVGGINQGRTSSATLKLEQRVDQEYQRAERLAAKLRETAIDP